MLFPQPEQSLCSSHTPPGVDLLAHLPATQVPPAVGISSGGAHSEFALHAWPTLPRQAALSPLLYMQVVPDSQPKFPPNSSQPPRKPTTQLSAWYVPVHSSNAPSLQVRV